MTTVTETAGGQWKAVGNLLARWRNRARLNQDQHWEAAKRFQRLHYLVGVPAVALSAIVGTTVFATLQKQVGLRIQLLVGGISLLAAVLAVLQTFLGFSARAEQHKSVAAAYGAIRRRLETLVTLPVELRGDIAETVKLVEIELDNLAKAAPTVPNDIYQSVQPRLAADPDTWPEMAASPPFESIPPPSAAPDPNPSEPYQP
jgi:hypothetical protein